MTQPPGNGRYDNVGIPGLMRLARRAYGNAVRTALGDAGIEDLPRNGAYVLARVRDERSAAADLTLGLGISKQAVSQLIDAMVTRGYLERTPDAGDRRRVRLALTPRGEAAATISWQAATRTDEELERRLSPDGVAALRAGLIALCEMSESKPGPDAAGSTGS